MAGELYYLDEKANRMLEQLFDAVTKMRGGPGIAITNTRDGIVISLAGQAQAETSQRAQIVIGQVIITAAGADSSHWAWKFALRNSTSGKWGSSDFGSESSAECVIADGQPGYVGMKGLLCMQLGSDSVPVFTLIPLTAGSGLIPVSLTFDSGDNGDPTNPPSYTYKWPVDRVSGAEIKNADGTRATGLSPESGRQIGKFDAATRGMVYINSSGNPVLFYVHEVEQVC